MIDTRSNLTGRNKNSDRPFVIGRVDPDKGFVHVFDEATLDILMAYLDTVSDFVAYLTKKEQLLTTQAVMATGEEELLGYYLNYLNEEGQHDFPPAHGHNLVLYDAGTWDDFVRSPQRAAQIKANRVSYALDDMIERTSKRALNGVADLEFTDLERVLRYFAREPRTRRRMIARFIVEMANKARPCQQKVILPARVGDPYYVLLMLPVPDFLLKEPEYEEHYRDFRFDLLKANCMATKVFRPEADHIVGFATGPGRLPCETSEDLMHLDATTWGPEDQQSAEQLMETMGLFKHAREFRGIEFEFPIREKLKPMILPKRKREKQAKKKN